jgi:hypothetical protein
MFDDDKIRGIAQEMFPDWVKPEFDRQWRMVLDGLQRAYELGRQQGFEDGCDCFEGCECF